MREEKWGTEPIRGPQRPMSRPVRRGGRPGADTNPIFNPGGGIRPSGNSHRNVKIGLQNDTTIDFVFDYTSSAKYFAGHLHILQGCDASLSVRNRARPLWCDFFVG